MHAAHRRPQACCVVPASAGSGRATQNRLLRSRKANPALQNCRGSLVFNNEESSNTRSPSASCIPQKIIRGKKYFRALARSGDPSQSVQPAKCMPRTADHKHVVQYRLQPVPVAPPKTGSCAAAKRTQRYRTAECLKFYLGKLSEGIKSIGLSFLRHHI
jgi:hypothetical protein